MSEICQKAVSQNVVMAEETPFFPGRQGYPAVRLNFSLSPDKIEQGISVLGKLLKIKIYEC